MLLACGEMDREAIEDPDRLFASRYNQWIADHGVGLSTNTRGGGLGTPDDGLAAQTIDLSFSGGEVIAISNRMNLRVLHVPGHSHGHLAFYDAVNRAVYVGDALHGNYCPSREGTPSLPPAYFMVLAYLASVQTVEALDVHWIFSAHWPTYTGSRVPEFLSECRDFVDRAGALIRDTLQSHPEGITLRECIAGCGPALGRWPEQNEWLLMYPVHGHLLRLEQMGLARQIRGGAGHVLWRASC